MKTTLLFILGMTLGTAPAAQAQNPCKDDIAKFCKGIERGQGRIIKCLKEHDAELTPECKAHRDEKKSAAKARLQEIHDACQDDAQKFCQDEKPGKGRIMKCLRRHRAELTPTCQKQLTRRKK